MMTLSQIRKKYRAASPQEALDNLAALMKHPNIPENYQPPVLTVVLTSGHTFRAYLCSATTDQESERTYLFSLEMASGDGAADLCYVLGSRIEAVTVWNVDDYQGILPRFTK